MIATAGADRLQEGMRRAFGKATGLAARVKPEQSIFEAYVLKENLELAKRGFKVASSKLGCPTSVKITELKNRLHRGQSVSSLNPNIHFLVLVLFYCRDVLLMSMSI